MQAAKQESSSEGYIKKVEPANKNELVKVSSNTKESEKEGQSKVAAK